MTGNVKGLVVGGLAGIVMAAAVACGSTAGGDNNPSGKADSYYTSCDHGNRLYEYDKSIAVVAHDPSCN